MRHIFFMKQHNSLNYTGEIFFQLNYKSHSVGLSQGWMDRFSNYRYKKVSIRDRKRLFDQSDIWYTGNYRLNTKLAIFRIVHDMVPIFSPFDFNHFIKYIHRGQIVLYYTFWSQITKCLYGGHNASERKFHRDSENKK